MGDTMPAPFDFNDDDAVEQALEEQLRAFRAKFGRDPGPADPLFFDPDADEPRPLNQVAVEAGMVDAMERAGISPAQIYGFQQTGIIPVEGLLDRVPAERLQEFYLAVRRYERLHLSAEENAEIDVAEAHQTAVLAVAAMLEGDSETFREVFTDGGPLMKIIPLAWVRNARDNLPKDLYRRAMADGVDFAARTMPVPVRRAAGELRSVMGTRPGAQPRPHDTFSTSTGSGKPSLPCSAWPAAWFAPSVAAIRNGCTTLTTTAKSTGTPASPPTKRTRSSEKRSCSGWTRTLT
jgi:hypothetical protein